ncbi:hypothetical protein [Phenylobacterium sp.]|uniref:hypothetical protein n=1 Tax=Phenylobacterium sp. TaxID=1871053 RepID=UPI003564593F
MRWIALAAMCAAGLVAALPADAASITYTISGLGSGSLAGTAFTDAGYTFTLSGDTEDISDLGTAGYQLSPLGSTSILIDGFSAAYLTDPLRLFINSSSTLGVAPTSTTASDFVVHLTGFPDISLSFGPLTGSAAPGFFGIPLPTSSGELVLDSLGRASVSAVTDNTISSLSGDIVPFGTPEPDSWMLMLSGFFALGTMLRRRQRAHP